LLYFVHRDSIRFRAPLQIHPPRLWRQTPQMRAGNQDRKWVELRSLAEQAPLIREKRRPRNLCQLSRNQKKEAGKVRKVRLQATVDRVDTVRQCRRRGSSPLLTFYRHRDTLNYLEQARRAQRAGWLVKITGGMNHQARKNAGSS